MQSPSHSPLRQQLPSLLLLGVLAAALSVWSLGHVIKSAFIYLQGAVLLFFMLVLAQRSRLVAYALLPLLLAGWFSYDGLYDVAGLFLQPGCMESLFTTALFHQHYLRLTYDISALASLVIILKGGLLYGLLYTTRRFLKPVTIGNNNTTWLVAGGVIILAFILLPLGIIPHFAS